MLCEKMYQSFTSRMRLDKQIKKLEENGLPFEYSEDYLEVLNMFTYPDTYKMEDLTPRMWLEHRVKVYDENKHMEDGSGLRFFDYTGKTVFRF